MFSCSKFPRSSISGIRGSMQAPESRGELAKVDRHAAGKCGPSSRFLVYDTDLMLRVDQRALLGMQSRNTEKPLSCAFAGSCPTLTTGVNEPDIS